MKAFRNLRAELTRLLSKLTVPATVIFILLWVSELAQFVAQSL